jgi:hypothetical protein
MKHLQRFLLIYGSCNLSFGANVVAQKSVAENSSAQNSAQNSSAGKSGFILEQVMYKAGAEFFGRKLKATEARPQ